jgi:hypothetical protein
MNVKPKGGGGPRATGGGGGGGGRQANKPYRSGFEQWFGVRSEVRRAGGH